MRIKHRLNGSEEDDFGLVNVEELNNQIDEFTGTIPSELGNLNQLLQAQL